jgi:hypothetical protein
MSKIVIDKSPLHPSALRLKDINPGRRITEVNLVVGRLYEYVVESRPFEENSSIKVSLREVVSGARRDAFANDLGLIPYEHGVWNDIFVIDSHKAHLLREFDLSPRGNRGMAVGYSSSAMALHQNCGQRRYTPIHHDQTAISRYYN